MRQFKFLFYLSLILPVIASCGKDEPFGNEPDNSNSNSQEEMIEYYVKYESDIYIPVSHYITIDVTILTQNGNEKLSVPRSWEGVFGPFKELKTLTISAKPTSGQYNENMTHCQGRISICRGNQPFILKADKYSSGTNYTVSYTVTKDDLK